jgi:hypothetical protein
MDKFVDKTYYFKFNSGIFYNFLSFGEFFGAYLFNIKSVTMRNGGHIDYNSDINKFLLFILNLFNVITWEYYTNGKTEGFRWIYSWAGIVTPTRYELCVPADPNWDTMNCTGYWLIFKYTFNLLSSPPDN